MPFTFTGTLCLQRSVPLPQVYPIPAARDPPESSIVPLGTSCAAANGLPPDHSSSMESAGSYASGCPSH